MLPQCRAVTLPSIDPATYLTTADLVRATYDLLALLPPEIDAVVGIARSGMLPAGIIATHLHVPLYSTTDDGTTRLGGGMRTWPVYQTRRFTAEPGHVLVLDDTAWSGTAMRRAAAKVRAALPQSRQTRAVVYAHPQSLGDLDYWSATYEGKHFLEWNLFNSGHAPLTATDLDGVICRDSDGGPHQLPRREPVAAIVTGRSERDRGVTVEWLRRWQVQYGDLIMGPWDELPPEPEIATWKGSVYRGLEAVFFVESSAVQAPIIREQGGKAVLCPALGRVL